MTTANEYYIDNNVLQVLKKNFVFDKIFNITDYDSNISELYNELKELKKTEYKNNHRFIFTFFDTQYHSDLTQLGLTLINLQRVLNSLDIPNYFCLLLTNQEIAQQLQQLKQTETTDDCSIATIVINHHFMQNHSAINKDINVDAIQFKYQALNRRQRFHRKVWFAIMKDKHLLDQGIVSYNTVGLHNNA